jgi:hypothetical protein
VRERLLDNSITNEDELRDYIAGSNELRDIEFRDPADEERAFFVETLRLQVDTKPLKSEERKAVTSAYIGLLSIQVLVSLFIISHLHHRASKELTLLVQDGRCDKAQQALRFYAPIVGLSGEQDRWKRALKECGQPVESSIDTFIPGGTPI